MTRWVVRELRAETWRPSDYDESNESGRLGPWRAEWEYVPLLRLAERVAASAGEGARSQLDDFPGLTAFVHKSLSAPRDALRLGELLREGDVLVPAVAEHPCVLVTRQHEGVTFGRSFAVLRTNDFDATALWGLLTSAQGSAFRRSTTRASSPSSRLTDAFWNGLLPILPEKVVAQVRALVPHVPLERTTTKRHVESRWYRANLRSAPTWLPSSAVVGVERLLDGVELQEIGRLFVGRSDPRAAVAVPGPGRAPLITSSWLRGKPSPPVWSDDAKERRAQRGTVALLTLPPFSARVVPEGSVLQRGLVGVECYPYRRAHQEDVASWLAAYFTGDAGFERLSSFAAGVTIPRLTVAALRGVRVPLPDDLAVTPAKAHPGPEELSETTLANQLDEAIWDLRGGHFDPSPFGSGRAPVPVRVR